MCVYGENLNRNHSVFNFKVVGRRYFFTIFIQHYFIVGIGTEEGDTNFRVCAHQTYLDKLGKPKIVWNSINVLFDQCNMFRSVCFSNRFQMTKTTYFDGNSQLF